MPTNDRHLAAVARAVESTGLDRLGPVDSSAVPGPSTAGLDAARLRASSELDRARARRDGIAAALDRRRHDRADAFTATADANRAATEATERRQRFDADADVARARLTQLDDRVGELAAGIERSEEHLAATDVLLAGLQEQLDRFGDAAVSPSAQHQAAQQLVELAEAASALGLHDATDALSSWSGELSSGTAALQTRAAALLVELDEAEREWQELGAGEVALAPAVVTAQSELDAALALLHEVDAEARSGGLGQRARSRIDAASRHRQSVEARGKKADPDELAAAIDSETTALGEMGFDSILDYRVALSTGGSGALADACRRNASDRVSQLEESLDEVRRATATTQQQVDDRLRQLRGEAHGLTGDTGTLPIEAALRGCLDTSLLRAAVDEIRATRATTIDLLQRDGAERNTLQDERRTVERARALALAGSVRAGEETEHAELEGRTASEEVTELDASLAESTRQLADADGIVADAAAALEQLIARRYLPEDVRDFSDSLIAAVDTSIQALEGHGASAVVIDDPLGGFDDDDALAVLDDLIAQEWAAPVLFVTSRSKLVNRLGRRSGQLRCIDGRRRDPGQRRWRRRQPRDAELS
jgi:chromosome segregation ATPase